MKKAELKNNLPIIVIKTLCAAIALVYFLFLIAGKQIFGAENAFYRGINIFLDKDGVNVWLRSLGYAIFLPALSYLVRLILKQVAKRLKKGKALVDLLCSFIKYIAVIALIFAILSVWGVNTAALLAGVGILSLIVGLGAQPLIEDIIAGLFIVFEHVFEVGDIIVVDGFRGTVKEIGIRTTQIEDAGGDVKVVNNSDIRTLVNMTSQLSLAISEVDIEYSESLERVELVVKDNLDSLRKNIPDIAEGPFYMGVSKLGASGDVTVYRKVPRDAEISGGKGYEQTAETVVRQKRYQHSLYASGGTRSPSGRTDGYRQKRRRRKIYRRTTQTFQRDGR